MVRNPTKRANARHLCAHLDLIEQHGSTSPVKTDHSDDDNEIESQPRPSKMKTEKWKPKNSSIDLIARPTSPNQTSRPRSTRSTRATVKVEMWYSHDERKSCCLRKIFPYKRLLTMRIINLAIVLYNFISVDVIDSKIGIVKQDHTCAYVSLVHTVRMPHLEVW